MMKAFSLFLLLISCFACTQRAKTLQVLDFGAFELKAPGDWHMVKKQGVNKYVGGLTNGEDSCWFDYARYNAEFPDDPGHWYRFTEDTVNGFPAIFSVPDSGRDGFVSMKIPSLRNGNSFVIWASKVKDSSIVLQIYKSALFPGSDTSNNSPLANVTHFDRTNKDGKALFVAKCEACHLIRGRVEGPRLQELIETRNAEWLHGFFTDKTLRANDRFHQLMKEAYNNLECVEIPTLTKPEAVALFYYIKSQPK